MASSRDFRSYRRLLLPLAGDGETEGWLLSLVIEDPADPADSLLSDPPTRAGAGGAT